MAGNIMPGGKKNKKGSKPSEKPVPESEPQITADSFKKRADSEVEVPVPALIMSHETPKEDPKPEQEDTKVEADVAVPEPPKPDSLAPTDEPSGKKKRKKSKSRKNSDVAKSEPTSADPPKEPAPVEPVPEPPKEVPVSVPTPAEEPKKETLVVPTDKLDEDDSRSVQSDNKSDAPLSKNQKRRLRSKSRKAREAEAKAKEEAEARLKEEAEAKAKTSLTDTVDPQLTVTNEPSFPEIVVHTPGVAESRLRVTEFLEKVGDNIQDISGIELNTEMEKTVVSCADKFLEIKKEAAEAEKAKAPEAEILKEFETARDRGLETLDEINQQMQNSTEDVLNQNFSSQLPGLGVSGTKKEEEAEVEDSVGMILPEGDGLGEGVERMLKCKIDVIPELDEEHRESERTVSVPLGDTPDVLLPENNPQTIGLHIIHPTEVPTDKVEPEPVGHTSHDASHPNGFVSIHDESNGAERSAVHALEDSIQKTSKADTTQEPFRISHVQIDQSIPGPGAPHDHPITQSIEKSQSVHIEPIGRESSKIADDGKAFPPLEPLWADLDDKIGKPHPGGLHLGENEVSEVVRSANKMKTQGDDFFFQKEYQQAVEIYVQALRMLSGSAVQQDKSTPEGVMATRLHANIASCKIKQERWEEAIFHCNLVIRADPTFVKAYYRAAQSYKSLGREEEALKVLKDGLSAAKAQSNTELQRDYIVFYNELVRKNNSNANKMSKKMEGYFEDQKPPKPQAEPEINLGESGYSHHHIPDSGQNTIGVLAASVAAGVATGGAFLAGGRGQAAAVSFGCTTIGVYAAQNSRAVFTKVAAIASIVAINLLLYKKL